MGYFASSVQKESLITCQFERLVDGERLVKYRMTSFGVAEIKLKRNAPLFYKI